MKGAGEGGGACGLCGVCGGAAAAWAMWKPRKDTSASNSAPSMSIYAKRVSTSQYPVDYKETHLENVDELVVVDCHQALECIERRVRPRAVVVCRAQPPRLEVRARAQLRVLLDLGSEAGHAEVVAPDLAVRRGAQEGSFKRRLVVDSERVDHAGVLLRDALEPAYPFAAVAECADALDAVWAAEGGDVEIPYLPNLVLAGAMNLIQTCEIRTKSVQTTERKAGEDEGRYQE